MTKLILMSFAALPLLPQPIQAAGFPAGTTSITFNGFCDGATITYSGSGSFLKGTHDNWDCNSGQTFVAGVLGQDFLLAPTLQPTVRANLADNVGVLGLNNCALQLDLDFTNNGWSTRAECDGSSPEALLNTGKFTIVTSPIHRPQIGCVASWQKVGAAQEAPVSGDAAPFPKGPYTLRLNGFCTSFRVFTGGFTRAGGLVDLSQCSGETSAPFAGNDSSLAADIVGTAGQALIITDNEYSVNGIGDFILIWYFNFGDSSWWLYSAGDSGGLGLVNHGTSAKRTAPIHSAGLPSPTGLRPH